MNRAEKLNTNYSFAFRLARDTRNWGSRVNRLFSLLLAISKITLHPTMSNRPIKRNKTVKSRFTAEKVRRRGYTRSFSSIIRTSLVNMPGCINCSDLINISLVSVNHTQYHLRFQADEIIAKSHAT